MPISITIPEKDLFDPQLNRFITIHQQTLSFEHSLLSISKWESKWHKAYLTKDPKTEEETLDYLRCMCLTQNVDPLVFRAMDAKSARALSDYISDPMTATTINRKNNRPSREIVTNELIYYWMVELGIPFDPCQKWHLNRLMTLIEVTSIKKQPPKKMGKKDLMSRNAALNAQRKARLGTHG